MLKILHRLSHGMTMSLVIPLESSILFHTCKVGTSDPCLTSWCLNITHKVYIMSACITMLKINKDSFFLAFVFSGFSHSGLDVKRLLLLEMSSYKELVFFRWNSFFYITRRDLLCIFQKSKRREEKINFEQHESFLLRRWLKIQLWCHWPLAATADLLCCCNPNSFWRRFDSLTPKRRS